MANRSCALAVTLSESAGRKPFWNSFRHDLSRPCSVSQLQLSFPTDSRWVSTALGKVALACPYPDKKDVSGRR